MTNKPLLRPPTKLGQGYVFTRVCDSVHRAGGPASMYAGIADIPCLQSRHSPGADPPQEQTPSPPCAVHAGRCGQQAGGKHPTGMHTCLFM